MTIRNDGFIDWTAANNFKLGNVSSNFPGLPGRIDLPPTETVQHGEEYGFPVTIQAPATAGVYDIGFRMLRENVTWFGETSTTQVTVTCP